MIKLPSPVTFSKYVYSILLSTSPANIGTVATTMGYGYVKPKIFPQNLQYIQLKTVDLQQCVKNTQNLISKNGVICASGNEVSICSGDVGGPLVSALTGKLVGVAISTQKDCTAGLPQGFTGIFAYTEWIDGVIEGVIRKN